jgi:peroxiredoxin (alkyl hydroperoxide reductase subunit C)
MGKECCVAGLQVGNPVPSFKGQAVVDRRFGELIYENGVLSLDGNKTIGKYLVLFFYPLDFTFVCPTEIIAFSERLEEFQKEGAGVVGVSVDSVYSHLAWKKTPRKEGGLGEIKFPLLADLDKRISCEYGVLLSSGIAARGTFIIDDKGILQAYSVNNLGLGRNVDEALRLVQAAKFTAEHGEVCPAGWMRGKLTMKPDPVGAKEYFSKANNG